jgi:hypothetical protein
MLTIWMMVFGVLGFRAVFPLPISLTANWILRVTELRPPEDYIGAVRRSLIALGVIPVWIVAALLSLPYRPLTQTITHLALLLLFGLVLAEFSLIGFHKVPFTCSYLPGKSNFQFVFWACFAGTALTMLFVLNVEFPALHHPADLALLLLALAAAAAGLRILNRQRARSAILYFEEPPTEMLTRLGLPAVLPPVSGAKKS